MGIIVLVAAAYIADRIKKPFSVALAYAFLTCVFGSVGGASVSDLIVTTLLTLAFCGVYFSVLIKVSDSIVLWVLVLAGFPVALYTTSIIL